MQEAQDGPIKKWFIPKMSIFTDVSIEHRFTLQNMRMHMLFKKTVDEDRQGSETNIIQSQVYTVVECLL